MSSVSKLRKMTIDNKDTNKETSQTKMQKLRQDSEKHEVIPGRGMSSYEEGIAVNNLKAYYEEKNKNKINPAGGFKKLSRKKRNSKSKSKRSLKRSKSKSKRSRSKSKRGQSRSRSKSKRS